MIGGNLGAAVHMLKIMNQQGGSQSWEDYWKSQSEVLFFGLYSEISGGQMPNKKTGSSDYLTVTGAAGSETYQCPNTAPYIAADTDYIWFKTDESQRTVTTAELIGYDLQRTPVKYEDESPNAIVAIIILNAAVTGTKRNYLFRDMWLSVFWDDSFSDYGHIKDNRGAGQQLWTPEVIATFYDTFTDTDDVKLINHTPDIGGFTWIDSMPVSSETWKIAGNKALSRRYNAFSHAFFDSGKSDVDVSVDLTIPAADNYHGGLMIRRNSVSNFWKVQIVRNIDLLINPPQIQIYKSTTMVTSVEVSHEAGVKTLRVVTSGNYFTIYWGGVKVIDAYETDGSYNTSKVHGLTTLYYTPYEQILFDNFIIV